MNIGDKVASPIFGEIEINEIFESEEEARAAGYFYDAHVNYMRWKVLGNNSRYSPVTPERAFCAAKVPV